MLCRLAICLIFVVGSVLGATAPSIPQNWQSNIHLYSEVGTAAGPIAIANWIGPMVNSYTYSYFTFNTTVSTWYSVPPLSIINTTVIGNGKDGWVMRNGLCSSLSSVQYKSFFQWMKTPLVRYKGVQNVTVEPNQPPVTCDVWKMQLVTASFNSTAQLCIVGNTPIAQSFTTYAKGDYSILKMAFSDFKASSAPPLDLPSTCSYDPYFCPRIPGMPTNVTMSLYRFHPEDEWHLENHNMADLQGDTAYICSTVLGQSFDKYDTLLSNYLIQMNSTWGVYAHCNNENCVPSLPFGVGREGVEGMGYLSGQCSSNKGVGSWYSMEGQAECPQGVPFGTAGCAWQQVAYLKTVSIDCLMAQGLNATCHKDKEIYGGVPFPYSSILIYNAFASTDPQQGGCPQIPPPASASASVSASASKDGVRSRMSRGTPGRNSAKFALQTALDMWEQYSKPEY